LKLTQRLSQLPPQTLATCKRLVRDVSSQPIDDALVRFTAKSIAHQRMSPEGLQGIHAFLNKVSPDWK
jgi:methylglutaconyl-CoA hydratase